MEYDPLLAKLVVWGETRGQTLARMDRALWEYRLLGIRTNIPYLRRIVRHPEFARGVYDTHFLIKHQDELLMPDRSDHDRIALAAAAVLAWRGEETSAAAGPAAGNSAASAWKMAGRPGVSDS
jgi:acetyl/propionyl-CoA carboxylase alpha subunit